MIILLMRGGTKKEEVKSQWNSFEYTMSKEEEEGIYKKLGAISHNIMNLDPDILQLELERLVKNGVLLYASEGQGSRYMHNGSGEYIVSMMNLGNNIDDELKAFGVAEYYVYEYNTDGKIIKREHRHIYSPDMALRRTGNPHTTIERETYNNPDAGH